jgi:tetratricopeptide (TPR) repeat protein
MKSKIIEKVIFFTLFSFGLILEVGGFIWLMSPIRLSISFSANIIEILLILIGGMVLIVTSLTYIGGEKYTKHIKKARKSRQKNLLEQVLISYLKSLLRDDRLIWVYKEVDILFNEINEKDKVASILSQFPMKHQNETPLLYLKCLLAFSNKDFKKSLEIINALLKRNPSNVRFLFRKMLILIQMNEFDNAVKLSEKIIEIMPKDEVNTIISRHIIVPYVDIIAEILDLYYINELNEKFVTMLNNYPIGLTLLGYKYIQDKKFKEGIRFLEKYLSEYKNESFILNLLGSAYIANEDYDTAIKILGKALDTWEKEKFEVNYMFNLSEGLIDGFFRKNFYSIRRDDDNSWMWLAMAFLKKGNLEQAYDCVIKAINLKPKKEYPWLVLANIHLEGKNKEKALEALEKASELNPQFKEALELKEKITNS